RRLSRLSTLLPYTDALPILQPSVGGRIFSYDFWSKFAEIENVEAIKAAPFNRYQTFDVMRAVSNSSRRDEIAMYTGNDDNIVGRSEEHTSELQSRENIVCRL